MNPHLLAWWPDLATVHVATALLHFLWQGTLVAMVAAAALRLLRDRAAGEDAHSHGLARANVRYAVSCAALLFMAALPIVNLAVLAAPAEFGERAAAVRDERGGEPVAAVAVPQSHISPAPPRDLPAPDRRDIPKNDETYARAAAAPRIVADRAASTDSAPGGVLSCLFWVWLAGVALLAAWHGIGWLLSRRLVRRGTAPPDDLSALIGRLAVRMKVRCTVHARLSGLVTAPVIIGCFKPVMLLPASIMTGLLPHEIEGVLAHELAHVKRHDYLVNLLQAVVETLVFYHPAVWWISHRIRIEREYCADDLAVQVCGNPAAYVQSLVSLAEVARNQPAHALSATGGSLSARAARLLQPGAARRTPIAARGSLLASLATAACLAVVLTAVIAPSLHTAAADEADVADKLFLNNVLSTSADVPAYFAPIPLDETVEVTGVVYHEDGSPAAGAEVWAAAVFVYQPRREVTHTDKDGRFRLHLTPLSGESETWSVKAYLGAKGGEASGYRDWLAPLEGWIGPLRGKAPNPVVVRLHKRGVVSGLVLAQESGRPLADARLYLGDGRIIVTDAMGAYRFGGLPPGNHRMTVVCAGRVRRRLLFDNTRRPDAELDITLPRGGKLRRRVLDEQGRPLADAAVGIPGSGNALAMCGRYVATDTAGNFVYDGVPFDKLICSIEASAAGYADSEMREFYVSPDKPPEPIVFRLRRSNLANSPRKQWKPPTAGAPRRDLRGIVRSPEGKPVAGATVKWAPYYESLPLETKTNGNGEFKLKQVPQHDGYVTVAADGFAPCFAPFKRDKFFVDVRLEPGRSVGGVVRGTTGRRLPGVRVYPVIPSPDAELYMHYWIKERAATTDVEGRFTIDDLPASNVLFDFLATGMSDLRNHKLRLGALDNEVTLCSVGAVRGRVLNPRGKPVRNFRVSVDIPHKYAPTEQVGGFDVGYMGFGVSFTDDSGRFLLTNVLTNRPAGGVVRLVIEAPGFGQAVDDRVHVLPLDDLEGLPLKTFRLVEQHPLRIDVRRAADGRSLEAAGVAFITESLSIQGRFEWGYDDLGCKRWKTDSHGLLDLKLPFSEATATVRSPGYARQHIEWRDRSEQLTVRMLPESVLSGSIAWKGGQSVGDCYINLLSAEHDEFSDELVPEDQGKFSFRELPSGNYTLTVRVGRDELFEGPVALKAGQTKVKRIVLTKKRGE